MQAFEPLFVSRKLSACAEDATSWQRRLRVDPQHFDDPLAARRELLSLSQYLEIGELLGPLDPLREPLQRWVHYLLEQRVNHWWYTHTAHLRYVERVVVEEPTRSETRVSDIVRSLLTDARRPLFCRALNQAAPKLAAATSTLWQRQAEVARKLGLAEPDSLASPLPGIETLAERVLTETDDMAAQFLMPDPGAWLSQVMASPSCVELPGHLNERNIAGWFRESRMLEAVDLKTWPLPAALSAASYMRVLYELGFELRGALSDRRQPFVIAHDPYRLEQHAAGWCFSTLFVTPEFLSRNLQVARTEVRDVVRTMATILLFDLRARALGVVLQQAAFRGSKQLTETQQAFGSRVFGAPFGIHTAGVLPRLRADAGARLVGACLGQQQALELKQGHNEDWYRNPRAIDQLRSLAARSPEFRADPARVDASLQTLLQQLKEYL
jgi:hypothetical protein